MVSLSNTQFLSCTALQLCTQMTVLTEAGLGIGPQTNPILDGDVPDVNPPDSASGCSSASWV